MVDTQTKMVEAETTTKLRRREADLLEYLARHPNTILSHDELLREVFGYRSSTRTTTLGTTIGRLRDALRAVGGAESIEAVYGQGYRFHPLENQVLLGRTSLLAAIDKAFEGGNTCVTLVAFGGVGKSTAARAWLGDEGTWCDLSSISAHPGRTLAEVLGLPPSSSPESLALAVGSHPVVLDNAEHVRAEVTALLMAWKELSDPPAVLVTSRVPLGIDHETVLPVPLLAFEAAVELVRRTARESGRCVEAAVARDLARLTGGHPLAIRLAVSRLRFVSASQLQRDLKDRLIDLRGRHPQPAAVATVLSDSLSLLDAGASSLLGTLLAFRDGCSVPEAEAVHGFPQLEHNLGALADVQLVTREGQVWRLHPLVRASAERFLSEGLRRDAKERWLDWMVSRCPFGGVLPSHGELAAAVEAAEGTPHHALLGAAYAERWRDDGGVVLDAHEVLDRIVDPKDLELRTRLDLCRAWAYRDSDSRLALRYAARAAATAQDPAMFIVACYQWCRASWACGDGMDIPLEALKSSTAPTDKTRFSKWFLLAHAHHCRGATGDAMDALKALEAVFDAGRLEERVQVDAFLISYLSHAGRVDEAQFHVERARRNAAKCSAYRQSDIELDAAFVRIEMGDLEGALECPAPTVASLHTHIAARSNRVHAMHQLGRFTDAHLEAYEAYRIALRMPGSPWWRFGVTTYANQLRVTGQLTEAERVFEELGPDEPRGGWGLLLAQRGRMDDAVAAQRACLAASNDEHRLQNRLELVSILLAMGEMAEASHHARLVGAERTRSIESKSARALLGTFPGESVLAPRARAWAALARRDEASLRREEQRFADLPAKSEPRWRLSVVRRLMEEGVHPVDVD